MKIVITNGNGAKEKRRPWKTNIWQSQKFRLFDIFSISDISYNFLNKIK